MNARLRRQVAQFREEHELAIHQLLPHAVAYAVALNEGDPGSCERLLEAIAERLVVDFKMSKPQRGGKAAGATQEDNVTPFRR